MIGHFPEGAAVTQVLSRCRRTGLSFEEAWRLALHTAQGHRSDSNPRWLDAEIGLLHARAAFERAYVGDPPERIDLIAGALLHAMENMYDDSADAELTQLMQAA